MVQPFDLRDVLDLETILAGDILVCASPQQAGGGSLPMGMMSCLIGQRQKMTTEVAKSLPIGAIVEIGRALDINTRRHLMFANKLFMEAFAPYERDETRRIYAARVLTQTWGELLGSVADKRYMVFLEFGSGVRESFSLRVIVMPSRVRLIVPLSDKQKLEAAFPLAVGIDDPVDDEFIIGLHVTEGDTDLSLNVCSPTTLVKHIVDLSRGMILLPPSAYIQKPSWLQRIKKFVGRREYLQPVFDKLSLYQVDV